MNIRRISLRTLLVLVTLLGVYFACMSLLGDRADRLASGFAEPKSNDFDFGDARSLKMIAAFHATDVSTLSEALTLRKRIVFSYDASLSHDGNSDCSVVNCRTEFSINLFGAEQVSHRQDFVSLFMPSNFPLETRVPMKY